MENNKLLNLDRKTLSYFLNFIFLRFILEFLYVNYIILNQFAIFRFEFNIFNYLASWITSLFFIFIFPKRLILPSDFILCLWLSILIIPYCIIFGFNNYSLSYLGYIFLSILLVLFFKSGKLFKALTIKQGKAIINYIPLLIIFLITLFMVLMGGLDYLSFDLMKVYEKRDSVVELLDISISSYLIRWSNTVFSPLILSLSIWRKNYFLVILIIILNLFWYGITGSKSIIFYPFFILFTYCLANRKSTNLDILPKAFSIICISSFLILELFKLKIFANLLIRRVFFIPAQVIFNYIDFFKENPNVYWSYSLTRNFIEYPYQKDIQIEIGDFVGLPGAYVNSNFIASGIMNADVWGVIFYSIIVGLILKFIDSLTFRKIPNSIVLSTCIVPCFIFLVSSDLLTTIVTHGLLVSLILILCLPKWLKFN